MLGVLVNALAILTGSFVGLLAKKGIPEKITNAIMTAIALCVIYIGVSGMLKGENTLVLIVSMVLGTAVGTLLDLDGRIERLGGRLERRFQRGGQRAPIAEGFVTASLLFCVGAMAILGSFNAGLKQDYELLFTKSLLDGISACMLSVSLGLGVAFSAIPLFVYQGLLALLGACDRAAAVRRGHRGDHLLRLCDDSCHRTQYAAHYKDQDCRSAARRSVRTGSDMGIFLSSAVSGHCASGCCRTLFLQTLWKTCLFYSKINTDLHPAA